MREAAQGPNAWRNATRHLVLVAALGVALDATSAGAAPVLERVVMLSRHGVRARYGSILDAAHPPEATVAPIGVCGTARSRCALEILAAKARARLPAECLK